MRLAVARFQRTAAVGDDKLGTTVGVSQRGVLRRLGTTEAHSSGRPAFAVPPPSQFAVMALKPLRGPGGGVH